MGASQSTPAKQPVQEIPSRDEVPHTEPSPSLVMPKHSRSLTAWLTQVHQIKLSGIPFRQPLPEGAVNYFELNFDIVHIVMSFLRPVDLTQVACVSKYFRSLADDNMHWHAFFARKTRPCRVPREHLGNWKMLFQHAKEASSLQELLGTLTSGATITVPPGVYPPMSIGAAVVGPQPGAAQDLMLIGVPRPHEPVIFETTTPTGLLSIFGAASLHNFVVRHRYVRPPEDKAALCAIYVRGSLTLENCEISAGTKGLYGVYGAEKSTLVVRNCNVHNVLGPAVIGWHFAKITIENCNFAETDGVEAMEDCDVTMKDTQIHKPRNNAVTLGARSTGRLERCRLTDGGGQGVQAEGKELAVIDCDVIHFQFSGVRSNESTTTLVVTDTRISNCATGVLVDVSSAARVISACIRQCTTAIEVSDGGSVNAHQCTLIQNKCGVAVSGPGANVSLKECIIRKNEVGVRVAVEAKADLVGCSIRENSRYGVHVTRFEGEGLANLADTYSANNDIAVSGEQNIFIDELPNLSEPRIEGDASAAQESKTAISQEVKVALTRGVCTFQLTGNHYRTQKVWRCLTCNLTGARGMCDVCRTTCHADHDVKMDSVAQFFCDCGAEGFCEVFARTKRAVEAARLV